MYMKIIAREKTMTYYSSIVKELWQWAKTLPNTSATGRTVVVSTMRIEYKCAIFLTVK
jgi:hypothetical protein